MRPSTDGKIQPRLFPADPFEGFGPTVYRELSEPVQGCRIRSGRAGRLRHGVRDHAPTLPGVYGMLDGKGRVVYIGKAKNLRSRLLSYFRVNSRDPKAGKIIGHTRALVWEQTADEFTALLRELELIQRLNPKFNVLGRPGHQRYHYICIGRRPAPYVYVTKSPTGKEHACYGPFISWYKSEDAARRLNDWFRLRDCPQTVPLAFAEQAELFPRERAPKCLRFEIGTCFGPCVGACTRTEYGEAMRGAKAFLDGHDRSLLNAVRERMTAAASRFEFEKARAMRDRLAAFEWLDDWLTLLRRSRHLNSFVYPLTGADGKERWYLIHRGRVRAVVPAPTTTTEGHRAATVIRDTFLPHSGATVLNGKTADSVLLVSAWFKKRPEEKAKLLTKSAALKRCEV